MAKEKVSDQSTPKTSADETPKTIKVNFGGTEVDAILDKNGRIIMPEEVQQLMAAGVAVLKQAGQPLPAASGEELGDGSLAESFKGLPIRELIANPLLAAAEAQEKLASVAWDYYKRIAFDEDGKTTRTLTFELNRPIVQGEEVGKIFKQTVNAPFIGLVPIPSLLVDRIDVDFQMEVTDTNTTTDKKDASVETNISAKWFGVSASLSGKVSSSRENTRTTNQTAKYQIHVSASQQPPTEGLSKLMDIMATCIEPMPTDGGK